VDDNYAEIGIDQAQFDQDEIKREEQHRRRKHLRDEEPVERQAAAKKSKSRKRVAGSGGKRDPGDGHRERDEEGIAQPAQEQCLEDERAKVRQGRPARNESERGREQLVPRPKRNG